MSNIKKNIFWLLITQSSGYIFPLLTLPYLIRVLGMEEYGVYALILTYAQYFILVVDFGYNLTATREIALSSNKSDVARIYCETMAAKLVLLLSMFILGVVAVLLYDKSYLYYGMLAFLSVVGNAFFPVWLYQGLEKMKFLSLVSVFTRAIVLLLTFILVRDKGDLDFALIIFSMTFIIPSLVLNINAFRKNMVGLSAVSFKGVISSLVQSLPIFISNFAVSFYTNLNSIVLSKYESSYIVGSYYSADRLRIAAQTLLTPVSQAIYPRICNSIDEGKNKTLIKYGVLFICFGLVLSICVYVFSVFFASIYFGTENKESTVYLSYMSPIIVIVSISMVFGHWFMVGNGFNKPLSKIYTFFSVLHLLYSFTIVKHFGGVGMVLATLLTQTLIAITMVIFYFKKRSKVVVDAL